MNIRSVTSSALIAFTFLLIGPIEPWTSRFSLLERAVVALALTFCWLWTSNARPLRVVIPISLILLSAVAGLSIFQFLRLNIVRDWLSFSLVLLLAIIFVAAASTNEIVGGLVIAGAILIGYTAILALLMPGKAFDSAGLLMGAFSGKNNLAISVMFTIPAILTWRFSSPTWKKRVIKWLVLTCALVLLLATKSASSLVAFGLTAATYLTLVAFQQSKKLGWATLVATSSLSAFALVNLSWVLSVFAKGPDFNGRLPLWQSTLHSLEGHWLTGYGWSNLFGYDSPAALFVHAELDEFFLHSHNELLYWTVMTGVIGASLLVITYVLTGTFSVIRSLSRGPRLHLWVPVALFALAFAGITEISSAYVQGWFILGLVATSAGKSILEDKASTPRWIRSLYLSTSFPQHSEPKS